MLTSSGSINFYIVDFIDFFLEIFLKNRIFYVLYTCQIVVYSRQLFSKEVFIPC